MNNKKWRVPFEQQIGIDIGTVSDHNLNYGDLLSAAGQDDREVCRAVWYSHEIGMPEEEEIKANDISDQDCYWFAIPVCDDENCLMPVHQILEFDNGYRRIIEI